jgi:glutamate/tyrosine decarboxylase-like PLP-dependent enzyme
MRQHGVMEDRQSILRDAAQRGCAYLEGIDTRAVEPTALALARLDQLGGEMPLDSEDPSAVLALLDEVGSPATVVNAGGRYFGFVNGGALPAALGANVLAAAWDQNAALRVMSPVAAALEDISLQWLRDVLHLPDNCGGAFVSGATMANFACLAAARHALLARAGWDVEANGLFGAPPITVIVGAESHASMKKALALVGLGRNRVVVVSADAQGRMIPSALPRLTGPTILCIQAGNVNTGAFDDAVEICGAKADAWVHVDGAFGLWAAASPPLAHLAAGFENADSWATDAHKWLNVPYDSGLAFVRDANALRSAMSLTEAAYLAPGEGREPMHYTPESSRRARGIEVCAALRSLGRNGLAGMIERTCRHATRFADGLRSAGFSVLNEVSLNQVLVSFGAVTAAVIRGVQAEGTCWCGGTVWQGQPAMRISVSSWATSEQDVERSIEAIVRVAHNLA